MSAGCILLKFAGIVPDYLSGDIHVAQDFDGLR
jgi:hypothetical protein